MPRSAPAGPDPDRVLLGIVVGDAVEALGWRPDGRLLAVGDLAGTAIVLDVEALTPAFLLPPNPGGTTALAWSPDGSRVVAGGAQGTVTIADGASRHTIELEGPVTAVAWSPLANLVAIAAGWTVAVVDGTGCRVATFGPLPGAVHDLAWARGPGALAAATGDAVAWLSPGLSHEPVALWEAAGAARTLALDPAGERLASGDLGGVLCVVDLPGGEELSVSGLEHRIERLAWEPGGTRIAVPDKAVITVWTLDGIALVGDEPVRLAGHSGRVTDLAYCPGRPDRLATVGDDGLLAQWSPDRAGPRTVDLGAPARRVCWRPGHRSVAVGCADGRVHLG